MLVSAVYVGKSAMEYAGRSKWGFPVVQDGKSGKFRRKRAQGKGGRNID